MLTEATDSKFILFEKNVLQQILDLLDWNSNNTGIIDTNIELGLLSCFANILASARSTPDLDQIVFELSPALGQLKWVVERAVCWL
jgi:hypothetical protein